MTTHSSAPTHDASPSAVGTVNETVHAASLVAVTLVVGALVLILRFAAAKRLAEFQTRRAQLDRLVAETVAAAEELNAQAAALKEAAAKLQALTGMQTSATPRAVAPAPRKLPRPCAAPSRPRQPRPACSPRSAATAATTIFSRPSGLN